MKLPKNIKVKGFLWTVLPIFSTYTGNAIYPNVYVPKHIYEDLKTKHPIPKNVSVLIHEQTHIERQKKMGWIRWGFKYVFFPRFRFNEELEATKASMTYLKKEKESFDTGRNAKYLSSWLYLWCTSYENAKEELDRAWEEA